MNDFLTQILIFMQRKFHRKELRFTGLSIVQEVFDAIQCRQTIEKLIETSPFQTCPFSVMSLLKYGRSSMDTAELILFNVRDKTIFIGL